MSLYCRIYDVSLKLVLSAEMLLNKTSLTIKDQVQANQQVAITQFYLSKYDKSHDTQNIYKKNVYFLQHY